MWQAAFVQNQSIKYQWPISQSAVTGLLNVCLQPKSVERTTAALELLQSFPAAAWIVARLARQLNATGIETLPDLADVLEDQIDLIVDAISGNSGDGLRLDRIQDADCDDKPTERMLRLQQTLQVIQRRFADATDAQAQNFYVASLLMTGAGSAMQIGASNPIDHAQLLTPKCSWLKKWRAEHFPAEDSTTEQLRQVWQAAWEQTETDLAELEQEEVGELSADSAVDELIQRTACSLKQQRAVLNDFAKQLEVEKLAAMKQLAYGASHEINNPLANIATRAQSLLPAEQDPERRRRLATIAAQAFRAHEMIANLMLYGHPPSLHLQPCDVSQLTRRAINEYVQDVQEQGTVLDLSQIDEGVEGSVDADHWQMLVKALVRNAIEAIKSNGSIQIVLTSIASSDRNSSKAILLKVTDNGCGIPAEIRRHVFDPFYSGREAGRGLGFGLSKVWRITELHGGQVGIDSPDGKGATISVQLPFAPPVAQ